MSTAIGGLKLVREARISIQKERLIISEKKIRVEYEFLNESNEDITTEVAFPIPEYEFEADDAGGPRDFDDFRVWVEGKPLKYQTDVKAICNGLDRTALLTHVGIDPSSFGHFDFDPMISRDFARLDPREQEKLIEIGLVDQQNRFPRWSVRKIYHWNLTFPSKRILHVSHEYKPVIGFMPISIGDLDPIQRSKRLADVMRDREHQPKNFDTWYIEKAKAIEQVCVTPDLRRRIENEARANNPTVDLSREYADYVEFVWVDYILTTANSWKTPIEDFELVINRPEGSTQRSHWYVSFCWDTNVERPTRDRFVAHLKNFVPQRELRIGFLRP